jgi:preprotein translocase subunit SecF
MEDTLWSLLGVVVGISVYIFMRYLFDRLK